MWLLNTSTLELENFLGEDVPPYAILSHTWGKDEVTFQDLGTRHTKKKAGFAKLRLFCESAKRHQFHYAWMDTCCIDKSSSAELSEAINSMYRWYQMSAVCYAYLEDVRDDDDPIQEESDFWKSRWFTRGWTLQELIAPSLIYFYSANWKILGSKPETDWSHEDPSYRKQAQMPVVPNLCMLLSTITGISLGVLMNGSTLQGCSAASRMSWAASRQTTRPEDIAYCLMGIFNVNMPLLYGEGTKNAFNRLQVEILKIVEDDTLLMHICPQICCSDGYHPPLASSPEGFKGLGEVRKGEKEPLFYNRNIPTQLTPKGLQVQLPLCPCELEMDPQQPRRRAYLAILDCIVPSGSFLDRGVIVLEMLPNGAFGRIHNLVMSRLKFETQEVIVKSNHISNIDKATSILIKNLRLEKIHISNYTPNDMFKSFFISHHMEILFQGIEQPPGGNIVLHQEFPTCRSSRRFLAKQFKLCSLIDEANGDAFIIILGAHKILQGRGKDQSSPYCKIFIKEPNMELQSISKRESDEEIYSDGDLDTIEEQTSPKEPAFGQPPSPQWATLELTGSKTAVVIVNSRSFLNREEHCFKLRINLLVNT